MVVTGSLSYALTAKEAKDRTVKGIIHTNDVRIENAADDGYCSVEMYMNNKKIEDYYSKLNFEIINGKEYGKVISWCE